MFRGAGHKFIWILPAICAALFLFSSSSYGWDEGELKSALKKKEWRTVFQLVDPSTPEERQTFGEKYGSYLLAEANAELGRPGSRNFHLFSLLQTLDYPTYLNFLENSRWQSHDSVTQSYIFAGFRSRETMPPEFQRELANRLMPMTIPITSYDAWTLGSIKQITDPIAERAIVDFVTSTPSSDLPFADTFLQVEEPSAKYLQRDKTENWMDLQQSRNAGLRAIAKSTLPHETKVAVFRKIFTGPFPHHVKYFGAESMVLNRLSDETLATEMLNLEFSDPGKRDHFMDELMRLAEYYHERSLGTEIWVVTALKDPSREIRQRAVTILNRWGKLETKVATELLAQTHESLQGFEKNASMKALKAAGRIPEHNEVRTQGWKPTQLSKGDLTLGHEAPLFNNSNFLNLLEDTFDELKQAKGYSFTPGETEAMTTSNRDLWKTDNESRFQSLNQLPWGSFEPQKMGSEVSHLPTPVVTAITPLMPFPIEANNHSMPDLKDYLNDRLGRRFTDMAVDGRFNVVVFAGGSESLARYANFEAGKVIRIPSPYSNFGIERYLVQNSPGKYTVYFQIPPIREYAEHYAVSLKAAGVKDYQVVLSESDRARLKSQQETAGKELWRKLPKAPDTLILGYDYLWEEMIKKDPNWKLLASQEFHGKAEFPLAGKLFVLEPNHPGGKPHTVLVVSSDQTMWGESSANITDGFLKSGNGALKKVLFFGSGGGPGLRDQYSVSVPSYFHRRDGSEIPIQNAMYVDFHSGAIFPPRSHQVEGEEVKIYQNIHHGLSVSPAEQTRDFVELHYLRRHIYTVDVETNLIAEAVAAHNKEWGTEVEFGAVHLITDVPASYSKTHLTGHTLSNVDTSRKQLARKGILHYALRAITANDYLMSCEEALAGTSLTSDQAQNQRWNQMDTVMGLFFKRRGE